MLRLFRDRPFVCFLIFPLFFVEALSELISRKIETTISFVFSSRDHLLRILSKETDGSLSFAMLVNLTHSLTS